MRLDPVGRLLKLPPALTGRVRVSKGIPVRMRDGAILRAGPLDEVMDSSTLGRVYSMTIDVIALPDGRKVCLPGCPGAVSYTHLTLPTICSV